MEEKNTNYMRERERIGHINVTLIPGSHVPASYTGENGLIHDLCRRLMLLYVTCINASFNKEVGQQSQKNRQLLQMVGTGMVGF